MICYGGNGIVRNTFLISMNGFAGAAVHFGAECLQHSEREEGRAPSALRWLQDPLLLQKTRCRQWVRGPARALHLGRTRQRLWFGGAPGPRLRDLAAI